MKMTFEIVDVLFTLLFFFSSRRRHTRYWRDWSSDVCSSDLLMIVGGQFLAFAINALIDQIWGGADVWRWMLAVAAVPAVFLFIGMFFLPDSRSEERRVGEECRFRGSPYYLKKKKIEK